MNVNDVVWNIVVSPFINWDDRLSEYRNDLFKKLDQLVLESKNFQSGRDFQEKMRMTSTWYFQSYPMTLVVDFSSSLVLVMTYRMNQELFFEKNFPKVNLKNTEILSLAHEKSWSFIPEISKSKWGFQWDLSDEKSEEIWKRSMELTKILHKDVQGYQASMFEKISDWSLGLIADFPVLRVTLLKFLALLPCLAFDLKGDTVKKVFLEMLAELKSTKENIPWWMEKCLPVAIVVSKLIPSFIIATVIRLQVKIMAKRFIASENINKSQDTFEYLSKTKRTATLDQLGELVLSKQESEIYKNKVLEIIRGLCQHVPKGSKNGAGLYNAHVSIKVSALASHFSAEDFDYSYSQIAPKLLEILHAAKNEQVFINIDAEHIHYRNMVWRIYAAVLKNSGDLYQWNQTGIVVQAYLKDAKEHLQEILDFSMERKILMPLRLVKGAYWDAETVEAKAHGHQAPQYLNKIESDLCFRHLVKIILQSPYLQLCLASHNLFDHAWGEAVREKCYPKSHVIEHQCLHMTYEALSLALAQQHWPTRNYVPLGDLLVGMGYLVRRIMENSSQVGFLNMMRSQKSKNFRIETPKETLDKIQKGNEWAWEADLSEMTPEFFNHPTVLLYQDKNQAEMMTALDLMKQSFPLSSENYFSSINLENKEIHSNSYPDINLGSVPWWKKENGISFHQWDQADIVKSVRNKWASDSSGRCFTLLKAAESMAQERLKLSSLIVYEAGKTIKEALGDVDEAIDFIRFYVRESVKKMDLDLIPLGKVVAISPWNFPLAIPCGMAVGPLSIGNHVVLKPAEQTPLIVNLMAKIFYAAGVPKEVLTIISGEGEDVGPWLLDPKQNQGLVFTGSRAVGTMLFKNYSSQYPVVTEMGGKNAIIITDTAELDETIAGVLASALGHSGQKCSACSRIIIDSKIKSTFIERFTLALQDTVVGLPDSYRTLVNPLISASEKERVVSQVKLAQKESEQFGGRVWVDRSQEFSHPALVGPVLIELPAERFFKSDSYSQIELFAPVLHLTSYQNLDEAIKIFNATPYALTGGVFCQSSSETDYLMNHLHCGNLYINRTCTGARVAIEPFGGFYASGTGPKAGGVDYLNSFQKLNPAALRPLSEGSKDTTSEVSLTLLKWNPAPAQEDKEFSQEKIMALMEKLQNQEITNELKFEKIWNHFFEKNGKSNISIKRDNLIIPGQKNWSDFNLTRDSLLILSHQSKLNVPDLLFLATTMGSNLSFQVVCFGHEVLEMWQKVFAHANTCGLGESTQLKPMNTLDWMKSPVVLGSDLDWIMANENWAKSYKVSKLKHLPQDFKSMPKLMSFAEQSKIPYSFHDYRKLLSFERSYALNTMRHGAPLEL
ncbi:MAG: bifunctional proline dehydrogenase/L-glutamate gamma-semialdehyde dehydrogenase [Bacteriovoracaceae bacterium]|nr:bifunctional proline dehydrogenase/L-glutamate gamma-semialdehyde dehydrogenase [Bacteriovoracaceae bacterium]